MEFLAMFNLLSKLLVYNLLCKRFQMNKNPHITFNSAPKNMSQLSS
jgi:hypothetical protein